MGTWSFFSDIDLALEGADLNFSVFLTLKARFDELNFPVEVDSVIRSRIINTDAGIIKIWEEVISAFAGELFENEQES